MQKDDRITEDGTAVDSDMKPIVTTSASIEANPMLAVVFFTVDGWSKATHLCTNKKESPVCGTHLNFPGRGHEVRIENEEVEQKWGDDKLQSVKWVRTMAHDYCQRCLEALRKNYR